MPESERLAAYRRWEDMLKQVDFSMTTATGFQFLLNSRPAYPLRWWRAPESFVTKVVWSDGYEEPIYDVDRRLVDA